MRKPVSVRRQKQNKQQVESVNHVVEKLPQGSELISEAETLQQKSQSVQTGEIVLLEKIDTLLLEQQHTKMYLAETEKTQQELKNLIIALEKEVGMLKHAQLSVSDLLQKILSRVGNITLLSDIHADIKALKSIGRDDYKTILSILLNKKQDQDTERTISFKLGKSIIDSTKNVENLIKLPGFLFDLKKENDERKLNKKNIKLIENPKVISSQVDGKLVNGIKVTHLELNKKFTKALTLLDPISELCWQDAFPGFAISREKFVNQIENTTSDFAFFESAWRANKSQWLYAFNSPNLQHKNAQDLLKVIGLLRNKKIPVVFWNKEDPMHYEMFKPIAKEADFVFTTDSLKVDQYKKDLGHNFVWALPFAAPVKITNPINRFNLETETVCFAGTYYAKNHPDRKKQMDMLLPTLLNNEGAIYDRASQSNSENYLYPEKYRGLIREGVEFDKMTELYKKFKVFLNVNTITQSPTMMSRRVYELLASGTPVVSTPSKALTEQFPGIVLTVRNEEEAEIAVNKLLSDSYFWHKQSVLGIREVMSKHTYEDRWSNIKSLMQGGTNIVEQSIAVRVVVKYHGYQDLDSLINSIFDQSVCVSDLVLVVSAKKYDSLVKQVKKYKGKVSVDVLDNFNFGHYLDTDKDGYTLLLSDAVMIFKNCIKDMLLSFKYNDAYVVARKVYYSMKSLEENNNLQIINEDWYNYINETSLLCSLVKNSYKSAVSLDINKGLIKVKDNQHKIYQIDPFNLILLEKQLVNLERRATLENFKYRYASKLGL